MGRQKKPRFVWDVFVSHSSAQKRLVRAIVHQWRAIGLSVFFDEDSIQPGEDIVTALDRARESSRHTVLIITPESIASGWVDQELKGVVYIDPGALHRRLIPVLLERVKDSEIPLSVRKLSRIDLTDEADTRRQYHRLLESLGVSIRPLPDLPRLESHGPVEAEPKLKEPVLETGAMPVDSPFYVQRQIERDILELLESPAVTITVKGYRQSGKSSLLARLHARAAEGCRASCILDFQGMVPRTFEVAKDYFPALAHSIADGLGLDVDPGKGWSSRRDEAQNLTSFLENQVLAPLDRPVLLLFDEADRTFRYPEVREALFSTLRFWHNRRADVRKGKIWKGLGMVVAHSTEPGLWLENLDQSPFKNVAHAFLVDDFIENEVAEIDRTYGHKLRGEGEIDGLMKLVGGHPYLVRLALYTIATKPCSFAALERGATDDDGPFASHLGHLLKVLYNDDSLLASVRKILKYGKCDDEVLFQRLWSAGLIRSESRRKVWLRYALYDKYFRERLL